MWTPLKSSGCEIRLIKSCRQMTPQTDDNKDEPREAVVTARSAGRLSWVGCIIKRLTSRFSRVFILAINSSLSLKPQVLFYLSAEIQDRLIFTRCFIHLSLYIPFWWDQIRIQGKGLWWKDIKTLLWSHRKTMRINHVFSITRSFCW